MKLPEVSLLEVELGILAGAWHGHLIDNHGLGVVTGTAVGLIAGRLHARRIAWGRFLVGGYAALVIGWGSLKVAGVV